MDMGGTARSASGRCIRAEEGSPLRHLKVFPRSIIHPPPEGLRPDPAEQTAETNIRGGANLITAYANHSTMRPRDLSFKEKQRLSNLLAGLLLEREEILFAYLYGSLLHGTFRDIDIGVFLRDESSGAAVSIRYETALEQELENSTGVPIDVRVLNVAPLPFAYSVLQTGEVLVSRDEQARCDFVCRIYAYLLPRFCLLPKALPEGSTWSPTRTRKSPHSRRSWCRRAGV